MPDPTWEVDLYIDGPVTIRRRIDTSQQKGFRAEDPFYSDIAMSPVPSGIRATITARASTRALAFEAAVFFFGQMLDVLTLAIDQPLYLSMSERQGMRDGRPREFTRRRIEIHEFEDAFQQVRSLAMNSPSFLRGLGWYRKGLYTDDPFDKFLAFWNSIEIVASKYYRYIPSIDLERAKKGPKNQIRACFGMLWGLRTTWPIIYDDEQWIDESNRIRSEIAHGATSVDITRVSEVSGRVPTIRQVAYRFLADARSRLLSLERNPPLETIPDDDEGVTSH